MNERRSLYADVGHGGQRVNIVGGETTTSNISPSLQEVRYYLGESYARQIPNTGYGRRTHGGFLVFLEDYSPRC